MEEQFPWVSEVVMDLATKQYLIAAGVIAVGLSGWLLPYRWNILKLKRSLAKHMSERTNLIIAKSVGTVLILGGLFMVVLTAMGEDFITRP
jgi:hypothetical protein